MLPLFHINSSRYDIISILNFYNIYSFVHVKNNPLIGIAIVLHIKPFSHGLWIHLVFFSVK